MRKHILAAMAVLCCIGMMACGGDTSAEPAKDSAKDTVQESTTKDTAGKDDEKDTPAGNEDAPAGNEDAPAATKAPEATQAPAEEKVSPVLSFEVKIDGDTYRFPMWYEEFEKKGWTLKGDANREISAGDDETIQWKKGDVEYPVKMYNPSTSSMPVSQCAVLGFRTDSYYYPEGFVPDIILPENIKLGVATEEDIISAYGEPTSIYEHETQKSLQYNLDYWGDQFVNLRVTNGVFDSVEIENLTELEGANKEVSYAVPDYVESYRQPTSDIGDETHMVFCAEGAYYELPCPVAVFLENGFTVLDTYCNMEVPSESSAKVRLRYGNHSLDVKVYNHAKYATVVQNCYVTEFEADGDMQKINFSVLGGIRVGDSISEVEAKLAGFAYEKEKGNENTNYSSTTFVVSHPQHATWKYWIYCSDKMNAVTNIKVTSYEKPTGGSGEPTAKMADTTVPSVPEDSIYSFRMNLHGDEMKIPMSYAELAAMGWVLDEEEDATAQLAAGESKSNVTWKKDGFFIFVVITNTTENTLAMSECTVTSVLFSKYSMPYYEWDTYNGEVLLPGGIKLLESTRAEIEAAYGEPSTGTATDVYYHLWYTYHDGRSVNLWVDNELGTLIFIEITNQ